jgi:6-phosphogluconate dehydrogenase
MPQADIGLVGLGVMGQNLALNMADHGFTVAVFNRTVARVDDFVAANPDQAGSLVACRSLEEFASAVKAPRAAIIMVKAGAPVDATIADLVPLFEGGDMIIDAGNEHYAETRRREKALGARGLHFVGMGVSGGEEGARHGPSIMVGGAEAAYARVGPIVEAIAARVGGEPCAARLGPDGAGHFVKMIHNGIEYADMAMIAEIYQFMRQGLRMTTAEMAIVFDRWNKGPLESYLIEITAAILKERDPETGEAMVDVILDRAGQKGTGLWSSVAALDLGVPAPTIIEAVAARSLSSLKAERVAAGPMLAGPAPGSGDRAIVAHAEQALFAAKLCAYAQGFAVMRAASETWDWGLDFATIAKIWRGGCIIRAQFLDRVREAFSGGTEPANLLVAPYFRDAAGEAQAALRQVVAACVTAGVAAPCLSSALAYYDGYRTADGPANLTQAQRDLFGAHTFERTDRDGAFHHVWPATGGR